MSNDDGQIIKAEAGLSWGTYVRAADTLQQQSSDLCLSIKLALGHPQLLLCLRANKHNQTFISRKSQRFCLSWRNDKCESN